jgi:hypothetical protein
MQRVSVDAIRLKFFQHIAKPVSTALADFEKGDPAQPLPVIQRAR